MVKVILQLYPVIQAANEEERERLRPIGRNTERYQDAIRGWVDIIKSVDKMGVWGVSSPEHHFHSEGYELCPSPAILAAYWAGCTENVRVGELGYVMSTRNPFVVAEETAVLDHLTQGRSFVGFARGYQSRWTDVFGQHYGVPATRSPEGRKGEELRDRLTPEEAEKQRQDDRRNRDIFEENVDLVLEAWTQDAVSHNSPLWQVPYPYDAGTHWTMTPSHRLGNIGESDPETKAVRQISVVPSPYTKPYPPVFVASNASKETVEYCGRKGFIPTYFSPPARATEYGKSYVDHARSAGYDFALGQNQAIVRWPQFGDTEADARARVAAYDSEIYKNFYGHETVGGLQLTQDELVDKVLESGLWVAGDVSQVRDSFVDQWSALPAEYVVLIMHYAQMPKERLLKNVETFMEKVKPSLDDLTRAYEMSAAK